MKQFYVLIFVLSSIFTSGQQVKEFFNSDDCETDEVDAFYYKVGMKIRNSNGSSYFNDSVKTFYVKTNSLRSTVNYVDGFQEGEFRKYFENGILSEIGSYNKNRETGLWRYYYPDSRPRRVLFYPDKAGDISKFTELDFKIMSCWDSLGVQTVVEGDGHYKYYFLKEGALRLEEGDVAHGFRDHEWRGYQNGIISYEENYSNGTLVEGISYYQGSIFKYKEISQPAEYPGGMNELYVFLNQNIRYPRKARRIGAHGKVFVQFTVNVDGLLSDIKIIKGVHETIDEESIRLVSAMPNWTPGKSQGRYVKSKFILPLTYNLE